MIGLDLWWRHASKTGNLAAPGGLWKFAHAQADHIGKVFDWVQCPPCSLTQSGVDPTGDGYGVCRYRMLDGTWWGSGEDLLAMTAAFRSYGCQVSGDLVLHQMIGKSTGYKGADGKTLARGNTSQSWFCGDPIPPYSPADDCPAGPTDKSFGNKRSYQHSQDSLSDSLQFIPWLRTRVGFSLFRLDDVKGMWTPAVQQFAAYAGECYGEYWDGNPQNLAQYASTVHGMCMEDFTAHYRMQTACNQFDATQFMNDGPGYFAQGKGMVFLSNPDTSPGDVMFNRLLGYAWMVGLPSHLIMVSGQDYFPTALGGFGLGDAIDQMVKIARTYAVGKWQVRYLDKDVAAYTRDGDGGELGWSGGLLTALNFNVLSERTVTLGTPFGSHRQLHDVTGHAPDAWTDGQGNVTITIPSNAYSGGHSYVMYTPKTSFDGFVYNHSLTTTQVFQGSNDLDIPAAVNGDQALHTQIYVAKGSMITLNVIPDKTGWMDGSSLDAEAVSLTAGTVHIAPEDGWYQIRLFGEQLPDTGSNYTLRVSYTGVAG